MSKKLPPTITLAKLFEAQKLYVDALQVYNKLKVQNSKLDLSKKIDELKEKVFSQEKKYSNLINTIFSLKDKKKFNILSASQYADFQESMAEQKELETYPEEMFKKELDGQQHKDDEPEKEKKDPVESAELTDEREDFFQENENIKNNIGKLLTRLEEVDLVKLKEVLAENLGEEATLHDVKLSDLNFALELLKSTEK